MSTPAMTWTSGTSYELHGGPYTASIASVGASLRSLRRGGDDLVVGFDRDEVRPVYRGAVLAPWPNRVVDGRYADAWGEHQLALTEPDRGHALHGLMAWYDFQPVEHGEDRLHLRGEIVPQQGYPHRVRVDVQFVLGEDGLSTEVTGTNLGTGPEAGAAPWGTGPHPYLRAGDGHVDDWILQLPAGQVLEVTPDRLVPVEVRDVAELDGGAYDFRAPRQISDTFIDHALTGLRFDADGWTEVRVTTESGAGVGIAWDAACGWVQVHTADRPDPAQHRVGLAVEPMTCAPDAYNSGRGLVRLDPGASHTAQWRIFAIEG